jgi:hypothetical protein
VSEAKAWQDCEAQARRAIKKPGWSKKVRLTKVRKLLQAACTRSPCVLQHAAPIRRGGAGVRPAWAAKSVRLVDGAPGQELQVDTGWVVTLTVGGQKQDPQEGLHLHAKRVALPLCLSDRVGDGRDAAIGACEAAWAFYGGVFAVLSAGQHQGGLRPTLS